MEKYNHQNDLKELEPGLQSMPFEYKNVSINSHDELKVDNFSNAYSNQEEK